MLGLGMMMSRVVAAADTYLIFPHAGIDYVGIGYVRLPSTTVRLLVNTGLVNPSKIWVDANTMQMFVADNPNMAIRYYQLLHLPDGKLITTGQQMTAVTHVSVHQMVTDNAKNLYWTGKRLDVAPWIKVPQAVNKKPFIQLMTAYTTAEGGDISNFGPDATAMTTDNFHIWFGTASGGTSGELGSVSKIGMGGGGPAKVADNSDATTSIQLTTTSIFYCTPDGKVYGIPRDKAGGACGEQCHQITNETTSCEGLAWDGDGTMYVLDAAADTVYSFPTGSLQGHKISKVLSGIGAKDLRLLSLDTDNWGKGSGAGRAAPMMSVIGLATAIMGIVVAGITNAPVLSSL